jgi:hypothetical protein
MIIKERVPFLLLDVSIVVGVYLFLYLTTPGYVIPFWNNPFARVLMSAWLAFFIVQSVCLLYFPKPRTGLARGFIAFYFFVATLPNIVLPLIGPAVVTIISIR